jgi:hypothetical protein
VANDGEVDETPHELLDSQLVLVANDGEVDEMPHELLDSQLVSVANDGEVDETPRELLNSRLVSVSANETSLMWQYFAMVNNELIMCSGIQYVYYYLLCLKKHPAKVLDSLVAIYNDTTGNVHKHIISTYPSLHMARKRQSLEPK